MHLTSISTTLIAPLLAVAMVWLSTPTVVSGGDLSGPDVLRWDQRMCIPECLRLRVGAFTSVLRFVNRYAVLMAGLQFWKFKKIGKTILIKDHPSENQNYIVILENNFFGAFTYVLRFVNRYAGVCNCFSRKCCDSKRVAKLDPSAQEAPLPMVYIGEQKRAPAADLNPARLTRNNNHHPYVLRIRR